jgi:tetratricopeptide (TPR) repeat protein
VGAKIELGGTRNPAAFEAYLRGSRAYFGGQTKDLQIAIDAFGEAIRIDPNYALAYVARSVAFSLQADQSTSPAAGLDSARADARRAIELAPDLGEAHVASAIDFESLLDFSHASEEYDRAFTLTPGNARVLRNYGRFGVLMGNTVPGLAALHRVVVLDPLNANAHGTLCTALFYAHRYGEAATACEDALALVPDRIAGLDAYRGFAYYALGNYQSARSACEAHRESDELVWGRFVRECLAITYDKLGRHADAEAELAEVGAPSGNPHAFEHAGIYAQWGNRAKALEWLETAYRVRDWGLARLRVDPFLDPLRQEPRFQAIERELKFPK